MLKERPKKPEELTEELEAEDSWEEAQAEWEQG